MARFFALLFLALGALYFHAPAADKPPTSVPVTQPAVPIIRLTPAAAKEILAIIKSQDLKNPFLRVGVKQEGTKFSYLLDLTEDKPAADDKQLSDQGITILINPKGVIYLAGTIIDFIESSTGRGFVFKNPNARPD